MRKIKSLIFGAGMATILLSSCNCDKCQTTVSGLNPAAFDTTINEKPVKLYTLKKCQRHGGLHHQLWRTRGFIGCSRP